MATACCTCLLYTSSLKTNDPYMVLRDFESYDQTKKRLLSTYQHDPMKWQKMSLNNIAQSGYFCADRAIKELSLIHI